MTIGFWQVIIILLVVLILFGGKGKVLSFFSEFAKGIKILKKELSDDNSEEEKKHKS